MEEEKHSHDAKRRLAPSEVVWHVSALADLLQIAGSPDGDNATLERWQAKLPAPLHVDLEDDLTDDDEDGALLDSSLEQVIAQLEGLQQYDQEYDEDHHNPVLDDVNANVSANVSANVNVNISANVRPSKNKNKKKDQPVAITRYPDYYAPLDQEQMEAMKEVQEMDAREAAAYAATQEDDDQSFPRIGPGYSDALSVVSDLTLPTVVPGLSFHDSRADVLAAKANKMQMQTQDNTNILTAQQLMALEEEKKNNKAAPSPTNKKERRSSTPKLKKKTAAPAAPADEEKDKRRSTTSNRHKTASQPVPVTNTNSTAKVASALNSSDDMTEDTLLLQATQIAQKRSSMPSKPPAPNDNTSNNTNNNRRSSMPNNHSASNITSNTVPSLESIQTGDHLDSNNDADYSNKQQAPAAAGGAAARRLAASVNNSSGALAAGNNETTAMTASKFGTNMSPADEPVNFFPLSASDSSSVSSPLPPNNMPLRYDSNNNSNSNNSSSKAPTKLLGGFGRARRRKSNSKTATGSSRNLLGDAIPEGEEWRPTNRRNKAAAAAAQRHHLKDWSTPIDVPPPASASASQPVTLPPPRRAYNTSSIISHAEPAEQHPPTPESKVVEDIVSTMGQDIDFIYRELSVLEEKMPPSSSNNPNTVNDQNTVYSNNSTMGATAKVKYTLKSVGRTLRTPSERNLTHNTNNNTKDKRHSSNKNQTTSTNPGKQPRGRSSETRRGLGSYGKTLSFSNLGQKDAYSPPVAAAAAAAAAPVMDSNPLLIDEDGFIISGGPMPSFSTSTGSNTSSGMGASTDRVFGGFVPTHLVTSTTSSSIGKQPQPHRGSYSSERKPAARRTTSNNPRDKKLDQMEEATLQRIDTLRQLVPQDNDDDTASHLESQLDFVEDEIMKQITRLRERTH